ncbi:Ca2+-dependent phosphoinositide-specific phospholipase C [Chryseobacterium polytrichastri]|uniref:Phosphoinositide phospholipase C, Ca2+-dependent n=1 Tax=Chryseobacterium polytrichastri TaxID=1302687 RepID=A0A1M6Q0R2_9FLAO|nr:Ca2+-dependent phosphoinositide-specific phospholipase C [Chryseobacterium polytrichastri]SHK13727.1 Phosphoinositide phospholipase C, Ca2+-dependent [Chryseobacterium polytrichastri]
MKKIILSIFGLLSAMAIGQNKKEFSGYPKELKINQIQVLGTHNSYAKPVDPKVIKLATGIMDKFKNSFFDNMSPDEKAKFQEYHPNGLDFSEALNYNHPDFNEQLNAGLRNLEIDVYYDPTGKRFNKPAAYEMLKKQGVTDLAPFSTEDLDKPGFKVMHIADIDFRTHYTTLKKALQALKDWSDKNHDHIPIFIQIEAKDSGMRILPNSAEVLKFDKKAFDDLDQEVLAVLGREKIITPDDVKGKYKTLNEAVLHNNWPTVNDAKGKFVFILLPSSAGISNNESPYLAEHPSLKGRMMFIESTPGKDHSAFILYDNAIVRQNEIQKSVKEGYLVRTRSDIETYEAKVNDRTREKAAFSSGAQIVSTDFFKKGNTYGTDYYVTLPGGETARCNPENSPENCKKK